MMATRSSPWGCRQCSAAQTWSTRLTFTHFLPHRRIHSFSSEPPPQAAKRTRTATLMNTINFVMVTLLSVIIHRGGYHKLHQRQRQLVSVYHCCPTHRPDLSGQKIFHLLDCLEVVNLSFLGSRAPRFGGKSSRGGAPSTRALVQGESDWDGPQIGWPPGRWSLLPARAAKATLALNAGLCLFLVCFMSCSFTSLREQVAGGSFLGTTSS